MYDPIAGRMLQTDPVGYKEDPDHLDLYEYVDDDPLDKADPTGNSVECYTRSDGSRYCRVQNPSLLVYAAVGFPTQVRNVLNAEIGELAIGIRDVYWEVSKSGSIVATSESDLDDFDKLYAKCFLDSKIVGVDVEDGTAFLIKLSNDVSLRLELTDKNHVEDYIAEMQHADGDILCIRDSGDSTLN